DEPVAPVAPRIAVRAAEYDLPAGLVAALEVHLRAHAAADRLLEVLEEVGRVRAEAGWPPLAAPIGQILASQALLHVLEARRYGTVIDEFRELVQGGYGVTPEQIDPTVGRAVELLSLGSLPAEDPVTTEDVREQAEGLAASEEELVLIAMFGTEAEELLRMIRARHSRDTVLVAEDADAERGERIRELVKIVQESGVGEIEIEDEGMRVSVRRADDPVAAFPFAPVVEADTEPPGPSRRLSDGVVRVESPMVGVFYRAPNPGAPAFVDIGDTVVAGQTLCILEAMKLFNELKAETGGVVKAIHAENAQPVEYGELLFELDPLPTAPVV
ncbi:MAG: acetyl-CoA carboxylase biotin carboxyl carrier protein, partial [Gaiellaceae bacterium]